MSTERDDYRPPRGYSWAPLQPGHTLTLRHGAYSPRKVDPLARELVEQVAGDLDYLAADPSYRPALWAWARAEARVQLLSEYIDEHGPLEADGTPRPALDALHRFERLASEARARLGLDPLSRARLGRDVTSAQFDLAKLWQQQDEAEQAARAAETAEDGSDPEAGE